MSRPVRVTRRKLIETASEELATEQESGVIVNSPQNISDADSDVCSPLQEEIRVTAKRKKHSIGKADNRVKAETPVKRIARGDGDARSTPDSKTPSTLRKARGRGGKESNVRNALGAHVDLDHAMERRNLWGLVTVGPKLSLMEKFRPKAVVDTTNEVSTAIGSGDTVLIPISEPEGSLARDDPLNVQFIKPETLQPIDTVMNRHDVYNFTKDNSDCNSSTINSGMINWSVAWSFTPGPTQYLAIGGCPAGTEPNPLFETSSGPGLIQIWKIATVDGTRACQHLVTYSHSFGNVWKLKWRPEQSKDTSCIGELSAVFSDGVVRVWSVNVEEENHYQRLVGTAYSLSIPDSGCVSMDWLSPTRIAASCLNGMFVVWDLTISSANPFSVGMPHCSYVNNIVGCGPTAPHIILTTSWDCDVKLTNIQHPTRDYLTANRERMNAYAATWCDFLNGVVVNEDLSGVRLVALRGGHSSSLASMMGTVTALDSIPSHPFIAIGDSSGALTIVNACRKVWWKKHTQYRRQIYQLDLALKDNHYRFVENFQIEELTGKKDARNSIATHMYPPEIGIRATAWNQNEGYEGLLASCSSKFVRIDDVTIYD